MTGSNFRINALKWATGQTVATISNLTVKACTADPGSGDTPLNTTSLVNEATSVFFGAPVADGANNHKVSNSSDIVLNATGSVTVTHVALCATVGGVTNKLICGFPLSSSVALQDGDQLIIPTGSMWIRI